MGTSEGFSIPFCFFVFVVGFVLFVFFVFFFLSFFLSFFFFFSPPYQLTKNQIRIRRAIGPGRVRTSAPVPSPCSLVPSGTGLQSWTPGNTIYGVLGGRGSAGETPTSKVLI